MTNKYDKKVTKRHHSVSFQNMKIRNIRFVGNVIGDIYWDFYDDDITVTSLVLTTQSVSAVFCHFATRKCRTALWVKRELKVNKSNKQTCLNIKH